MFQVRLSGNLATVALSKNDTLSIYTSNSVNYILFGWERVRLEGEY